MLATAAPCGPTHSAPSERPEHAVETWRTTLPCRVSRTCSSKIVAPKQAPQLSRGPCPCPRPLSQGTYASMRRGLYRGRAGPQSTCTAGCLGTLISAPLMKSSRRVLCRAPGLSQTTSTCTSRPPARPLEGALIPLYSQRCEKKSQSHAYFYPLVQLLYNEYNRYPRMYDIIICICTVTIITISQK